MGHNNFQQDSREEKKMIDFLTKRELDTKLIYHALGKEVIDSHWVPGNHKEFDQKVDFADGSSATFEWKMDKMCVSTGNLCIEYQAYGKTSGIKATTADYWVDVAFSNVHRGKLRFGIWKTEDLKKLIERGLEDETVIVKNTGDAWKGARAAWSYIIKESDIFKHAIVDKRMDIVPFIRETGIHN